MPRLTSVARGAGAASIAAAIGFAGRARGATEPMTQEDPDLSATLLFLGAIAASVALPLLAFRLRPGARRAALGGVLGVVSGISIWCATQPVNAGLEGPLLYGAGLAIGDGASLVFAPRLASLLAILGAVTVGLVAPLPAHLIARSLTAVGSRGLAAFSTWILFGGLYAEIVLGIGVLISSPALLSQAEGEARAHIG